MASPPPGASASRFHQRGLAEVEAAEELADEEDIGRVGDLGLEGRAGGEGLVGDGRAEVGKAAELFADAEEAGLGALRGRERVELVVADGSEEDGVGGEGEVEGGLREWRAGLGDGDAADEGFGEGEGMAAEFGDGTEDVDGFGGDLGADAVAGKDCDVELHLDPPGTRNRLCGQAGVVAADRS